MYIYIYTNIYKDNNMTQQQCHHSAQRSRILNNPEEGEKINKVAAKRTKSHVDITQADYLVDSGYRPATALNILPVGA